MFPLKKINREWRAYLCLQTNARFAGCPLWNLRSRKAEGKKSSVLCEPLAKETLRDRFQSVSESSEETSVKGASDEDVEGGGPQISERESGKVHVLPLNRRGLENTFNPAVESGSRRACLWYVS